MHILTDARLAELKQSPRSADVTDVEDLCECLETTREHLRELERERREPAHQFIVVAYRWGWTNGHQYFVYAGTDKEKAIALAKVETNDRGGKYGCAVYEFADNGIDYQQVFYTPSGMEFADAQAPYHNHRIDYFERLGHFMDEVCDGHVYLPVPGDTEGVQGLKHTLVEPPAYMIEKRKRELDVLAMWEKLENEKTERRSQPREPTCSPIENLSAPSAVRPSP